MIQIELRPGKFLKIDDEDIYIYLKYKWKINSKGYVTFSKRFHMLTLSRLIMKATDEQYVDHINGDKLDNRKENLRFCSPSENSCNRFKFQRAVETTSKFKGVCYHKRDKKWQAQIMKSGVNKFIGRYDTEMEAALAYNKAALELHGGFARINNFS